MSIALGRGNQPIPTIDNIFQIMQEDEKYANVRFNVIRNAAEVFNGTSARSWNDADIAESLRYMEERYGIYSADKHTRAFKLLMAKRQYNPIIERLSAVEWDGEERCIHFLTRWGRAENTPYVQEVSRLIFAGGIWRLLHPGCKFDDVPVLIGNQGSGKSSLCRFIAIDDDFFGEVKDVEGTQAIEQIQGKWICEIAELSAFTKAKEIEAVKAYITRQRDQYRKPYDKEPVELERRCIFIGTSNNRTPLVDKTGNRRFYPVELHSDGYDIFDAETEIRFYALQCWAEAMYKCSVGCMPNYASRELKSAYITAQENAMQDDWRTGAIKSYLDTKQKGYLVCARELMRDALYPDMQKDPTLRDSREIGDIMMQFSAEWQKEPERRMTEKYGQQRCWRKL